MILWFLIVHVYIRLFVRLLFGFSLGEAKGDGCIKVFVPVSDVLRLREESGAAHLRERRPGTPSPAGDPPAAAGLAGDELLFIWVLFHSLGSLLRFNHEEQPKAPGFWLFLFCFLFFYLRTDAIG